MKLTHIAALCAISTAATFTQAAPIWQDSSLTALYGENYKLGTEDRTTLTAEYAAKLKYSDVFFFVDQQWDGNDDDSTYFELAPRLSLGETTGQN